jgi:hypothetical protein
LAFPDSVSNDCFVGNSGHSDWLKIVILALTSIPEATAVPMLCLAKEFNEIARTYSRSPFFAGVSR